MELERWKELAVVLECGSLTAAARKLGYTLSAMSRSISALEEELGFKLLNRGKKGVTPTKECELLLPKVRELLFTASQVSQAAASIRGGEEGEIAIGTAYRHYYRWLTKITSEFHRLHPGVQFKIYNGTSTEFIQKLNEHMIDFCIVSEREGGHEWYPICDDKLIALLPVNHVLAHKNVITIEEFIKYPYIATCPGLDIDSGRFFKKYGIEPDMQFSTMDIQATYAMVDAGMGISITNEINSITSYAGICHRDIKPTQIIQIGLACLCELSPVSRLFLEYVRDKLPE